MVLIKSVHLVVATEGTSWGVHLLHTFAYCSHSSEYVVFTFKFITVISVNN